MTNIPFMLYLDYAASSPIRPEVLEDLNESLRINFANPSSSHSLGKALAKKLDQFKSDLSNWLGAEGQIVFTGSATEANNQVIQGLDLENKKVLYTSADHPSLVKPAQARQSLEYSILEGGRIDEANLLSHIDDSIGLVLLTLVNSQSGIFQDVENIAVRVKELNPKVHIHVDAVQGFTKVPFEVGSSIDSVALSGHKIGGPKGIGVLWIRKGVQISPLLLGGGQENNLRSSTVAFPLAEAFTSAASLGLASLVEKHEQVRALNRELRDELGSSIAEIEFPFKLEQSSPYILTFLFKGISSDIILRHLEQKNIFISSTSACSSKIKGDNPTFLALRLKSENHKFVLRVSFGQDFNQKMKDEFLNAMLELYQEIQFLIKR